MRITNAKEMQIGNLYMYKPYASLNNLAVGVCVSLSEDAACFKELEKSWCSSDKVPFIKERYPEVKYRFIADYDKRVFNAYQRCIKKHEKELDDILNGHIKKERKKKSFWKKSFLPQSFQRRP